MKTYKISTVKAKNYGYTQNFTALTLDGETFIMKNGYVNDFKESFEIGSETINSASLIDAFKILQLKQDIEMLKSSRKRLSERISKLESHILSVFGKKLRGVKNQTRLNNFFNRKRI